VGFILENIVYQEQAVSSGTQGLNRKNTFRGDFVYNFLKRKKKSAEIRNNLNPAVYLKNQISKVISNSGGYMTSDKLYEKIIPFLVNKNLYKYNGKTISIEDLLKKNFKYQRIRKYDKYKYVWTNQRL
jgi:hypothetical protein